MLPANLSIRTIATSERTAATITRIAVALISASRKSIGSRRSRAEISFRSGRARAPPLVFHCALPMRSFWVGGGRRLYANAERKFARADNTRVVKHTAPDLRVARSRHRQLPSDYCQRNGNQRKHRSRPEIQFHFTLPLLLFGIEWKAGGPIAAMT